MCSGVKPPNGTRAPLRNCIPKENWFSLPNSQKLPIAPPLEWNHNPLPQPLGLCQACTCAGHVQAVTAAVISVRKTSVATVLTIFASYNPSNPSCTAGLGKDILLTNLHKSSGPKDHGNNVTPIQRGFTEWRPLCLIAIQGHWYSVFSFWMHHLFLFPWAHFLLPPKARLFDSLFLRVCTAAIRLYINISITFQRKECQHEVIIQLYSRNSTIMSNRQEYS